MATSNSSPLPGLVSFSSPVSVSRSIFHVSSGAVPAEVTDFGFSTLKKLPLSSQPLISVSNRVKPSRALYTTPSTPATLIYCDFGPDGFILKLPDGASSLESVFPAVKALISLPELSRKVTRVPVSSSVPPSPGFFNLSWPRRVSPTRWTSPTLRAWALSRSSLTASMLAGKPSRAATTHLPSF